MDMTKANVHKIQKIYTICMAAYSCVVGVLFIWQVWSIFRSAPDNPYTVASITSAFSKIAVFVWIWLAALLFGAFLPKQEQEKVKGAVPTKIQIERLQKRLVLDDEERGAIKSMQRFRLAMRCATVIVWIAMIIVGVCFLTDTSYTPRFDREIFQEHNALVDRIVCFVPWVIGCILVSVVTAIKIEKSRILQLALMKNMLAQKAQLGKIAPPAETEKETEKEKVCCFKRICGKFAFLKTPKALMITRIAFGVVGIAFVVFGIYNGGMKDVLDKAVKICTQCIGLG